MQSDYVQNSAVNKSNIFPEKDWNGWRGLLVYSDHYKINGKSIVTKISIADENLLSFQYYRRFIHHFISEIASLNRLRLKWEFVFMDIIITKSYKTIFIFYTLFPTSWKYTTFYSSFYFAIANEWKKKFLINAFKISHLKQPKTTSYRAEFI